MRDNRNVILMLWCVIAVLVIGGSITGFILVRKADELSQTNADLTSNNDSLHRQLLELRAQQASPSPSATPQPTATPSITPKASASPSATPTPSTKPRP